MLLNQLTNMNTYACIHWGFRCGSVVENPMLMQEMCIPSLCWEAPLKRKWQPIPVFLPGKSHGWRSLAGSNPWDSKELDMV